MDTLIWQMARLHWFWEPNNYKLPFPCSFMLLSVMLHRARDADTEKWLYSLPVYTWRGIADSMWRSLSPEPLVEEAVFSLLSVKASSEGQWDDSAGSAWVWAPGSTGQRELTTESCPLISALLPPSLSHITSWLYVLRFIFVLSSFSGLFKPFFCESHAVLITVAL